MDIETIIMVLIADREWTRETLHRACILARKRPAKIALVKMIPVQHPSWLGTDLGYRSLSEKDFMEIADYQSTIEDYGVPFNAQVFQYVTLSDAIFQSADNLNAQFVFATLPRSVIPFWRGYQLQALRRHLAQHQRRLIERPVDMDTVSPLVKEPTVEA